MSLHWKHRVITTGPSMETPPNYFLIPCWSRRTSRVITVALLNRSTGCWLQKIAPILSLHLFTPFTMWLTAILIKRWSLLPLLLNLSWFGPTENGRGDTVPILILGLKISYMFLLILSGPCIQGMEETKLPYWRLRGRMAQSWPLR